MTHSSFNRSPEPLTVKNKLFRLCYCYCYTCRQNYQHFGSEVFMSMSADATCRGLRNARDGQFVLELTKGNAARRCWANFRLASGCCLTCAMLRRNPRKTSATRPAWIVHVIGRWTSPRLACSQKSPDVFMMARDSFTQLHEVNVANIFEQPVRGAVHLHVMRFDDCSEAMFKDVNRNIHAVYLLKRFTFERPCITKVLLVNVVLHVL